MTDSSDRSTFLAAPHPDDLAKDAGESLVGKTLHDTYKVVRFLAEGGMGQVYEAQHTRISTKRFAIKMLHSELKHSLEVRMRFRREAEAAASIDHPNVVGVHDFGYADDGTPYLVCDYLDGRELGAVLDAGVPLSVPLSISIAKQLCRGLEAAHDRGVIHRDLKPANVFLVGGTEGDPRSEAEPEVKVIDFGLSRMLELSETNVTQTGVVMGTPSYMSPEQARGERVDHRVDVYGVGAVLYACLTGKPPYEEESQHATVLAVMSREPVRPCALVSSIPAELEVIVQSAMARNPAERYASMRDLEAALTRFESSQARPGSPAHGVVASRGSRAMLSMPEGALPVLPDAAEARNVRRRAVGWLLLAALLVTVGAVGAALGAFVIAWPDRRLLPSEVLLVAVAVVGSLFTPGVLFVRWLKRAYWGNSARMVTLVVAVRGPVLAALAVYGIGALLGRTMDTVSTHLMARAPAPNASGWLGWSLFLFGVAVLAASGALLRQRMLSQQASLWRRVVAGPVMVVLVLGGSAALVSTGYGMRDLAEVSPPAPAPSAIAEAPPPDSPPVKPTPEAATSKGAATPAESASPAVASASSEEIAEAVSGGIPALTALRSRFPKDPKVLRPLALALAKEPERASELLRVLDALFTEEPAQAKDAELAAFVQSAALVAATSQRAIDLMRDRMGLRGAEMLFDLVLAQPEIRPRARAALDTSEVQALLSPALKIAYDLYSAPSCSARVELLPQAVRDGDPRAVSALSMSMQRTIRGCGPKKNKPCPAPCAKEVPAFEQAIKQIRARKKSD
ncbi:MAG: serine/threonine protein kinase [Myxococcales bacterium]|nr:serine/threonine protein kinase [Myxococcales bacterium]